MQPTVDDIRPNLPDDAFDVEIKDYVARWKKPNSYAAKGYTTDARFLAASFLCDIQTELPALKGWKCVDYDNSPATDWSDRAALSSGTAKIWVSTHGYGANAYTTAELSAYAIAPATRRTSPSVDMKAALSRPIAAIAKDVARKLLPHLDGAVAEILAREKAEREASDMVRRKAEGLAKRYPNLKIRPDVETGQIRIETKYGAGVHLDAYAYRNSVTGIWCLTSDRGTAFRLDDIDKPYARRS